MMARKGEMHKPIQETLPIKEADREKVSHEIAELQERALKMVIPTILSLGLIATGSSSGNSESASSQNMLALKMYCMFGILFGSSLYVACLCHKIYRNAGFLKTFPNHSSGQGREIIWEKALDLYRKATKQEIILGSEMGTIGLVYTVLALVFFLAFKCIGKMPDRPLAVPCGALMIVGTALLLCIAFVIIGVYLCRKRFDHTWEGLIDKIEGHASVAVTQADV